MTDHEAAYLAEARGAARVEAVVRRICDPVHHGQRQTMEDLVRGIVRERDTLRQSHERQRLELLALRHEVNALRGTPEPPVVEGNWLDGSTFGT